MMHTDELELNEEFMVDDLEENDVLIIAYGSVSSCCKRGY
jgi:2-oxoglutarate/2-oxoacid ferredoxin oxidoreductase subunit alpha